jgi:hypothetical protein
VKMRSKDYDSSATLYYRSSCTIVVFALWILCCMMMIYHKETGAFQVVFVEVGQIRHTRIKRIFMRIGLC